MTIDRSGEWWRGTEAADLDPFLVDYSAAGYPVHRVVHARCHCGGSVFSVRLDDDEGCAERTCLACGTAVLLLDSEDTADDAELEGPACPCGNETFEVAVGFAFHGEGEDVRWVSVGLRCVADGVLGVYTDWKIDYSPSLHLLDRV